jgi:hypothetical protein
MFLPGAAATQGEVLSLVGAVALARSRWLSGRAHGSLRQCRDRRGGVFLRD